MDFLNKLNSLAIAAVFIVAFACNSSTKSTAEPESPAVATEVVEETEIIVEVDSTATEMPTDSTSTEAVEETATEGVGN